MSAARYNLEWDFDYRDLREAPDGEWVKYEDYLALQSALREALDGWALWMGPSKDKYGAESSARRNELLAQFLDDK